LTGFVGKSSEISWMQRIHEHTTESSPVGPDIAQIGAEINVRATEMMAFFVDETTLLSVDEDFINPVERLPWDESLILTEAALCAMNGAFRLVDREQFLQRLAAFPWEKRVLSWRERRWLSLANLLWAIGSRWLVLTDLEHSSVCHSQSHLLYYARSRALGLDHRVVFDHPDLEQVQSMGLLAFFLIVNNSISRSVRIS